MESDSDESEDNVKIILHQPEEQWPEVPHDGEGGADEPTSKVDNDDAPSQPDTLLDALSATAPAASTQPAATASAVAGSCSARSTNTTPHKKYVNPNCKTLQPESGDNLVSVPSTRAATAAEASAQRAKLGPLAHMPGGLELDLAGPLPDNIDVDSVPDKPWRKPEADITDFFNYGFTEDTWRLYCQRQQEVRQEQQQVQRDLRHAEAAQRESNEMTPEMRLIQHAQQQLSARLASEQGAPPPPPHGMAPSQLPTPLALLQKQLQQRLEQGKHDGGTQQFDGHGGEREGMWPRGGYGCDGMGGGMGAGMGGMGGGMGGMGSGMGGMGSGMMPYGQHPCEQHMPVGGPGACHHPWSGDAGCFPPMMNPQAAMMHAGMGRPGAAGMPAHSAGHPRPPPPMTPPPMGHPHAGHPGMRPHPGMGHPGIDKQGGGAGHVGQQHLGAPGMAYTGAGGAGRSAACNDGGECGGPWPSEPPHDAWSAHAENDAARAPKRPLADDDVDDGW